MPEEVILEGLKNEESQDSVTTGLDALQVDDHSTNQITEEEIDSSDGQSNEKDSSESDEDEKNLSVNSDEEYVPLGKSELLKNLIKRVLIISKERLVCLRNSQNLRLQNSKEERCWIKELK